MKNLTYNYLAILVAFILVTGLGFLWYGPLFGEPWMGMVGLDPDNIEAPSAAIWISNFIASIIPIVALAWLFQKITVESGLKGALIGLMIGFCFVFLTRMTSNLFEGRPYALSWITGGFDMVALTLTGLILGAWRKYKE